MVWLDLNKIGVWWCDWEVLEVVVEGTFGDVGGEGREGVLRGERAGVGDVGFGGVPHVFCGIVIGGVRGHVDRHDALQSLAGGIKIVQSLGVVEPGVVQDHRDLLPLIGLARQATRS